MKFKDFYNLTKENNINSIRDHLISRGLDPDRIGVVVDEKNNIATFFLYNLSGKLVGYQQYNPMGDKKVGHKYKEDEAKKDLMKYYSYVIGKRKDKSKEVAVWGLDSYDINIPYLFIVEGIFDAVSLHNAKVPAIAVLTNDPSESLLGWLRTLPQKKIVICDNDESGDKLIKAGDFFYKVPSNYKDLNEMSQNEVNDFVNKILKDLNLNKKGL
ncbi:MAG: toprim domain-containing protein [Candidatus Woesearchaeota archaeon]